MTKTQLALKWFGECMEHQIECEDETCEQWWTFAGFLKKNATPRQIEALEEQAWEKMAEVAR